MIAKTISDFVLKGLVAYIPFLTLVLFVASSFYDESSRLLRISFFLIYFGVTTLGPRVGLLLCLVTIPFFEVPTLLLDFPNQFIIEAGLSGFLASVALRCYFLSKKLKFDTRILFLLHRHPFFYPLVYACLFSGISWFVAFGEIISYFGEAFSKKLFVISLLKRIHQWDVFSPVHALSIVLGFLIHLSFLVYFAQYLQEKIVAEKQVLYSLLAGFVGVLAFSIVQRINPGLLAAQSSLGLGGTFQNGNHLSFYSVAIVVCLLLAVDLHVTRFYKQQDSVSIFRCLWLVFCGLGAVWLLIVGEGRASWLGVAIGGLWFLFRLALDKKGNLVALLGLVVLGGLIINLFFPFWKLWFLSNHESITARIEQYEFAVRSILTHPLTGIGLGTSFQKSGLFYEIHNVLLAWTAEMGLAAGCVILFSMILFFESTFHTAKKLGGVFFLAYSIFCGALLSTVLFDNILLYRPLALLTSILLLLILSRIRTQMRASILCTYQAEILTFVLFISITFGLASFFSPQTHPVLGGHYDFENTSVNGQHVEFRWRSIFAIVDLKKTENQCLSVQIKSSLKSSPTTMFAGHLDRVNWDELQIMKLSDLPSWEQRNVVPKGYFEIDSEWSRICFCQGSNLVSKLYLRSNNGQYLEWLRDYPNDHRFLSFAIGQRFFFQKEKLFKNKLFPGKTYCHELIDL